MVIVVPSAFRNTAQSTIMQIPTAIIAIVLLRSDGIHQLVITAKTALPLGWAWSRSRPFTDLDQQASGEVMER